VADSGYSRDAEILQKCGEFLRLLLNIEYSTVVNGVPYVSTFSAVYIGKGKGKGKAVLLQA
jgi:hypothetical protein